MRRILLIAPLILTAAPALCEPLQVSKGMWTATTDVYFNVTNNGQLTEIPPEHERIDECWSKDEDVTLDEGLVDYFEGCSVVDTFTTPYSIDFDLSCDFSGLPMTGIASFAVSKGGDSFVGRIYLDGASGETGAEAEALMIGHRTGTCAAPN
ncbi:hypothetical protein [Hyphomonas sp.]|jgi:hypothetical protein|uniref:hypothetical protein n=1 Tax=Hyphomonas sp. TaxID=87 RepID=UPI0025BEFEFD|nr:hypothetical protein [Hyphomonas sp.]